MLSHAIKPVADHIARHDCPGLAGEDQKSRLKSILGVLAVVQYPAAYRHDHGAVAFEQCCEGGFIAFFDEAAQKFPIRLATPVVEHDHPSQVIQDAVIGVVRHEISRPYHIP